MMHSRLVRLVVMSGVNFVATRNGSQTLLEILKAEGELKRKIVHLQCWRSTQLCSAPCPGATFRRADHVFTVGYGKFKNGQFTEWERWNFIEILLRHMLEEMKLRATLDVNSHNFGGNPKSFTPPPGQSSSSSSSSSASAAYAIDKQQLRALRAKQEEMVDIERNSLHAKAVRQSLNIRIVNTKTVDDTVGYIIRVEDIESGLIWFVHRRYSDFLALHKEINNNTTDLLQTNKIVFPNNRINLHIRYDKLIDQRVVGLENYLRKCLQCLFSNVTVDLSAAKALRRLQTFLMVDKHIDCIHPPYIDDQHLCERIVYTALTDPNNTASQQVSNFLGQCPQLIQAYIFRILSFTCVLFVLVNIDLESYVEAGNENGYRPMLLLLNRAMTEMNDYMRTNYYDQLESLMLTRKPEWRQLQQKQQNDSTIVMPTEDASVDLLRQFIFRCIRRQVELAMFLPIRRDVFKLIFPFIALQALKMQQSLEILQEASTAFFGIDPLIPEMKCYTKAIKSFREVRN
jgi:hypothetical protein